MMVYGEVDGIWRCCDFSKVLDVFDFLKVLDGHFLLFESFRRFKNLFDVFSIEPMPNSSNMIPLFSTRSIYLFDIWSVKISLKQLKTMFIA